MLTRCTSLADFLVSLSPALSALLSAIALWVASQARSTSKGAQQTSQAALRTSQLRPPSAHVVVDQELLTALRSASSKAKGNSASEATAQGRTSTSPGK